MTRTTKAVFSAAALLGAASLPLLAWSADWLVQHNPGHWTEYHGPLRMEFCGAGSDCYTSSEAPLLSFASVAAFAGALLAVVLVALLVVHVWRKPVGGSGWGIWNGAQLVIVVATASAVAFAAQMRPEMTLGWAYPAFLFAGLWLSGLLLWLRCSPPSAH